MIAKMTKYALVLHAAQSDDFIEKLRELGLVDITVSGWEPSDEDRQLLLDIEGGTRALESLKTFRADAARFDEKAAPCATGEEAYAVYTKAQRSATALHAELSRLEKSAEELRPWGEFDPSCLEALAEKGIVLRYFSAPRNVYDKQVGVWSEQYTLSEIHRSDTAVWFVVVAAPGEELSLDAQELKAPRMDIRLPYLGRPTLPGCLSHSSPRMAHMPMTSVIEYISYIFSGSSISNQARLSHSEQAPPVWQSASMEAKLSFLRPGVFIILCMSVGTVWMNCTLYFSMHSTSPSGQRVEGITSVPPEKRPFIAAMCGAPWKSAPASS